MGERLADPPHPSSFRRPQPPRGPLYRAPTFEQASAYVLPFSADWKGMTFGEIGSYHRGLSFLRWLYQKKQQQRDTIGSPAPSANEREEFEMLTVFLNHPSIQARKPMRVPKPAPAPTPGHKPCPQCKTGVGRVIATGFGKDHDDIRCESCGFQTNEDYTTAHAWKVWDAIPREA